MAKTSSQRSVEVRYLVDGEEVGHVSAVLPDMPLAFDVITSVIDALVFARLHGKSEGRAYREDEQGVG